MTYRQRNHSRALWHRRDTPIIESLLDTDFYKFTMGQLIFLKHPDPIVELAFRCRTKDARLARRIDKGRLLEELDHAMSLTFRASELHYLRGTNEYSERMFQEPYLQHLKGLRMTDYTLEYGEDDILLRAKGPWSRVSYWETPFISIITELLYESMLKEMTTLGYDAVIAEGVKRLVEKIRFIKNLNPMTFIEFGTRRRFSADWQRYVTCRLKDEIPPEKFRGTSNTMLAMDLDLLPMGTNAHEMPMVYAGLADLATHGDGEAIRSSQVEFLRDWWGLYGEPLSVGLPDTFGSNFFFRVAGEDFAKNWRGTRQDSGDPVEYLNLVEAFYRHHDVDPKTKLVIFSDGLTPPVIEHLVGMAADRVIASFGWGTNLTNDLGLPSYSLIVKPIAVNDHPIIKLSDNIAKATGEHAMIDRYKGIVDYHTTFTEDPTY